MLRSEADRLRVVVVCRPNREYFNVDDLAAHNIIKVADPDKALSQHDTLGKLLQDFGSRVIDLPELPNHPNAVFTRDTAVCTPEGYIELIPGIATRAAEGRWMATALDRIGVPRAGVIVPPGTVDGGDVVLCDPVAFIGQSQRTNRKGCRQLSAFLEKMGFDIRIIPLPETVLHLDKVMMPVSPGKLIVCTDTIPADFLHGFEVISIAFNDTSTANMICLGDGELIVGDTNYGALRRLADEELTIHPLDISEFIKGAGGPNCLIMPVTRSPL